MSKTTSSKSQYSWPLIVGVSILTTLIFFSDIVFGTSFFWDDISQYVYPMASYGAKLHAQGITPFWNPYMFNGMPFIADFQAQYFYPAHWIFPYFIDEATGLLQTKIIEYVIILHFVIAQLSMVYLMRGLGASQWGALIAGISYAFSGALAVRTNHPMIIYHLALFPLIIHHVLQGLQQARILNVLYAGLILGIAILAGHAQTSTYMLLFIAVIGFIGFVQGILNKQLQGITAIRYAGFLALPVIIAASLAAIQYLPGQELAGYSERNDITYEKTTDGSMQLSQFFHAFNPSLHGKIVGNPGPKDADGQFTMMNVSNEPVQTHWYWDTSFYFGILALILGLLSLLVLPKTPLILTCQYLWIFAFLYGIGNNGFLHELLSHIPIFGQFRNPGRMMFYASFGFPLLAGLTFDQLPRIVSDEKMKKRMFVIMAVPFIILALIVFGIIQSFASVNDPLSAFAGKQAGYIMVIAIIGSLIIILRGKETLNPLISGIALCGLIFLDLHVQFKDFHGSKENPQTAYIIADDLRNQLSSKFPQDIFRVSMRNQYGMAFQRNGGMNAGIMLYEGYNPILLSRRVPPLKSEEDRFDILNIRYAIALDSTSGSLYFKKRESAYGHARMVFDAKVISDDSAMKNAIMNAGSELKNIAYMEKAPAISLSAVNPDSVNHNIKTIEYGPNQQQYKVETSINGILCLSDIWYPAWKATINGNDIDIHRINWSLRGIEVPKGNHTIVMTYDSKAYATGSTITYSGLGLTILGIAFGLFVQKRRKNES
ncbi:MAG: hypothetical protein FJ212_00245 [Ignavibacteria bacterium]|nr:hypothetical protein [Ignavibacteria bacterium]